MRVVRRGQTYLMYVGPVEARDYLSLAQFWPIDYYRRSVKTRLYPNELGAVRGQDGRWNRIILDREG